MIEIKFYLGWMLVTVIWSAIADKTKKEVLWRFGFTFIFTSVFYWYLYVR